MLSGISSRNADTEDEAVEAYHEIRAAGGSVLNILDLTGNLYTIDDLVTGTQAATRHKERSGPEV